MPLFLITIIDGVRQLPPSTNWSFQTAWCPRNPDILATASFDGKIGIHTLQSTGEVTTEPAGNKTASVDDIFGGISASYSEEQSKPVMSLKQPPKWLKRPVAASFGFGGRLASASNLPGASGKHQSGVVHLRQIVTETEVVERAKKLQALVKDKEELKSFCGAMTKEAGQDDENAAGWKALYSLFNTNSRDELVTLLGFSKDEIEQQVSEAVKKFKKDSGAQTATDADAAGKEEPATPRDTAVTFAEKTEEVSSPAATEQPTDATKPTSEATPSEFSTTSDATKKTEAETEATEQSLFGEPDDGAIVAVDAGTPAATAAAAADFFSSMGTLRSALPDHVTIPHQGYAKDSSVAATIGSRASSVASDNLKVNTFKIYPSDESEVDRLITRALVLGDFESAVTLSLSVDRFADALVLAVKGGPELLTKTQKAYFERRTAALPYLRLFQSIVSNDLSDVVQNAELSEWKEIFVVLCTFARQDEFNNLAEQLGQRLEFRYKVAHGSEDEKIASRSKELRKDALLCYLAAGKLEKLVKIWLDEMREEEEKRVKASEVSGKGVSRYTAHAAALQTFIEKVTVFKMATGYQDVDLAHPTQSEAAVESGARIYKLAALYDRYYEYADMLASQGLVELAVDYVSATPADYKGAEGNDAGLASARERYMAGAHARKVQAAPVSAPGPFAAARAPQPPAPVGAYGRPTYGKPAVASSAPAAVPPATSTYTAYAAPAPAPVSDISTNPYAGASTSYAQPPQSLQYGAPQASTYGAYGQQQHAAQPAYPPPPPMAKPRPTDQGPPVPAAQRRDIPGWNDAPSIGAPKRPSSASSGGKPMPIMSPFPESQNQVLPPPQSPGVPANVNQPGYFAPPPRAHGPPANLPPPPKATTSRPPPAGPPPRSSSPRAGPPPPGRAGPAPHGMAGPPPPRAMSPLVPPEHRMMSPPMQMQPRPPSANPYVQAPTTAQNAAHAAPAPGPYGPSAGINVPRAGPPPAALRPPASAPAPAAPAAAAPASPVAKAEPPKSKYRE
jgi:protein transport protein SEC31